MSLILHIPHYSKFIPNEYISYFLLSKRDLEIELLKMTDHYTDELFDIDHNKIIKLKFPFSRLLVDVERFENDYLEPMSKVGMGCIYQKTHNGNPLKDTDSIKTELINKFYKKHHKNFTTLIDKLLTNYSKVLIIDCHSYPKNFLEYELNKKMNRPEICIGTDNFHTPEELKKISIKLFKNFNLNVKLNQPFKGTIVPLKFFNKDKRVLSIMIEVRRDLYMDEQNIQKNKNFLKVKNILKCVITGIMKQVLY